MPSFLKLTILPSLASLLIGVVSGYFLHHPETITKQLDLQSHLQSTKSSLDLSTTVITDKKPSGEVVVTEVHHNITAAAHADQTSIAHQAFSLPPRPNVSATLAVDPFSPTHITSIAIGYRLIGDVWLSPQYSFQEHQFTAAVTFQFQVGQ